MKHVNFTMQAFSDTQIQYAAYVDCPQCLSPEKTLPTVWGENVVKVY